MNKDQIIPVFRDPKFGNTDFKRLENFLSCAYAVCKDIDSSEMADKWPEDIRMHVAEAYNLIYMLNRPETFKELKPQLFKEL